MVHTVDPETGKTIYDPGCGTGGFLAIAYEHLARKLGNAPVSTDLDALKHDTFFGREKENLVFPIALANLVLHGIDQPNLWHGNTLTGRATPGQPHCRGWKEDEVNVSKPFPSYASLLSKRGTPSGASRYCWTVDFAARRASAGRDATAAG